MTRTLRYFVLVMVCLNFSIPEASAHIDDWWGWLEEFSGPGPFKSGFSLGEQLCWQDKSLIVTNEIQAKIDEQTKIGPLVLGTPGGTTPCIWLDQRFSMKADATAEFPEITAHLNDGGIALSFQRSITVGAGLGYLKFDSKLPSGNFPKTRFVITPIRVTVSPAIILAKSRRQADPNWKALGIVKMTAKMVLVPRRISGQGDFGVAGSTFEEHNDNPLSFGLQLDLLELETVISRLFR